MSEMSDPINNPPSYYLLSDGTEIREMIRQTRGDESTIEHLAQSIMEYAGRLGKKPGASRADDFRKIARNAIQGVNVCEGRSVSDNGDPPTEPTGIDLSRVVGMLTRGGVVHLYEREDDLRAAMDSPDGWDRVMWTDGARIHTADTNEPTPTPAPPPEPERPSVALPVVFAGERVPASGVYVGTSPAECEWSAFFIAGHTAPCPIIGPIPPACEWPTKPEGEGVPPPEPEPVLDQHEDGVYLPNSRKACHARIRRLDRELTEASEHLQKVVGHGVGILCVADAAKAIVEPLLRPHVTLPVVSTGERVPTSGIYVSLSESGHPMWAYWPEGYTTVSSMFGPIPPACGWPKPEGEWEIGDA